MNPFGPLSTLLGRRPAVAALVGLFLFGVAALSGCLADDETDDEAASRGPGEHVPGDEHSPEMHDDHHGDHEGTGNLPITGAEMRVINVTAGLPQEYRFFPDQIQIPAGARIGIVFINEGNLEHEIVFEQALFEIHGQPGETKRAAFIAPAPGTYEFYCEIVGHREVGMVGTMRVV